MIEELFAEVRQQMDNAVEALRRDLSALRTGRASVTLLDGIRIDYYGSATPLNQVANLGVPEPRLITIKPWEQQLIPIIEKAILAENSLGLNPSNDGQLIRIPIPELTEERRREYTKLARQRGEDGRVAVRQGRRDGLDMLDELQKDGDISEDDGRRGTEQIQKITDEFVKGMDELIEKKEQEIMEI